MDRNQKKMIVTYSASGAIGSYGHTKETIKLAVEIDPTVESYPDTLEFLRSQVLENLDQVRFVVVKPIQIGGYNTFLK